MPLVPRTEGRSNRRRGQPRPGPWRGSRPDARPCAVAAAASWGGSNADPETRRRSRPRARCRWLLAADYEWVMDDYSLRSCWQGGGESRRRSLRHRATPTPRNPSPITPRQPLFADDRADHGGVRVAVWLEEGKPGVVGIGHLLV